MYSASRATAYCELCENFTLTQIHTSPNRAWYVLLYWDKAIHVITHKEALNLQQYLLVCVGKTFIMIEKENEENRERGRKSDSGYDVNGFRHPDWMRWLFFPHLQHRGLFKIGFISVSTVSKPYCN